MNNSHKFTSHHEIVSRLSKKFKSKEFDTDTVHDWCAEAENDILRMHEYFTKFVDIKLKVEHKISVILPCNVHSIIDIKSPSGQHLSFYDDGALITLKRPVDYAYVTVDYKGTPVDHKTGDVLILRGHELFCEWTCVKNSHLEDFLNGKMAGMIWQTIDEEYEKALNIAVSDLRYFSRADFSNMNKVNGDMLPVIGRVPQYKEGL